MTVYTRALHRLDSWWQEYTTVAPFLLDTLPPPSDLIAPELPEEAFDRISVAYGLSYPKDDLGRIKPPHEIDDLPPPQPPQKRPHHEDLYS